MCHAKRSPFLEDTINIRPSTKQAVAPSRLDSTTCTKLRSCARAVSFPTPEIQNTHARVDVITPPRHVPPSPPPHYGTLSAPGDRRGSRLGAPPRTGAHKPKTVGEKARRKTNTHAQKSGAFENCKIRKPAGRARVCFMHIRWSIRCPKALPWVCHLDVRVCYRFRLTTHLGAVHPFRLACHAFACTLLQYSQCS